MLRHPNLFHSRTAHWLVILLAFLPAMAAVLPLTPFGNTMEDLTVLTAQEVVRTGQWAVPTLWGQPRIEKPPLAHWVCAVGLQLGGRGPVEFSARWTSLLLACLGLIVTYEWGRLIGGWRTGLVAAAAAGSTLFFLRFARQASYDGQLLFWVALANLGLFRMLFRRGLLAGFILATIGLSGAMLTKGPPALLHTIVPFAACCLTGAAMSRRASRPAGIAKPLLLASVVALIALAAMLPWAILVAHRTGGLARAMELWQGEIALTAERQEGRYTSPLNALIFLALLLPWTIWFAGSIVALKTEPRTRSRLACLLTFALLPVAIHALIPPMPDRYLVPMLPPAAIAAAMVYMSYIRRPTRAGHLAVGLHLAIVIAIAAGYPLVVALRSNPEESMALPAAIVLATVAIAIAAGGMLWQRKWAGGLVLTTVLLMLLYHCTYIAVRSDRTLDARQAAQEIARFWPEDAYLCDAGYSPAREVAIELDRPVMQSVPHANVPEAGLLLGRPKPPAQPVAEFQIGQDNLHLYRLTPATPSTRP